MPADPDTSSPAATPQFVHHFKLPTFSIVDASIWFCRADVQFCLKKVTNAQAQANHVLAVIPDTFFPQMSDWLDSKGDDPIDYQDLKTFLLKKFSPTAEKESICCSTFPNRPLGASARLKLQLRWGPFAASLLMQQATAKRSTSSIPFGYDAYLLLSVPQLQIFQISATTT